MTIRPCPICKKPILGSHLKKYCTIRCRSTAERKRRSASEGGVVTTDHDGIFYSIVTNPSFAQVAAYAQLFHDTHPDKPVLFKGVMPKPMPHIPDDVTVVPQPDGSTLML